MEVVFWFSVKSESSYDANFVITGGTFTNDTIDMWPLALWRLTRYVKLQVAHAPGMPGTFPPAAEFKWKLLLSDPGMHHGTCVTHVPWCMSGSLTHGGGKNVPGIPGACASAILRIWQEAHCGDSRFSVLTYRMSPFAIVLVSNVSRYSFISMSMGKCKKDVTPVR